MEKLLYCLQQPFFSVVSPTNICVNNNTWCAKIGCINDFMFNFPTLDTKVMPTVRNLKCKKSRC